MQRIADASHGRTIKPCLARCRGSRTRMRSGMFVRHNDMLQAENVLWLATQPSTRGKEEDDSHVTLGEDATSSLMTSESWFSFCLLPVLFSVDAERPPDPFGAWSGRELEDETMKLTASSTCAVIDEDVLKLTLLICCDGSYSFLARLVGAPKNSRYSF